MAKQVFLVNAIARDDSAQAQATEFLVEAPSHREAWKTAREAARSGQGALVRDPQTKRLRKRLLSPHAYTVKRVLSTEEGRRGRPPKLTAQDLLIMAERQGLRVPTRIGRLIDELTHSPAV